MKIAIIGADGQLGSELVKILNQDKIFPLYYPDFDVTQPERCRDILSQIEPEIVINTSAFHRVDECEDNPEMAFLVNAIAVRSLSLIARNLDFVLVHFSTDYVFDGRKRSPYVEEDCPHPLNVYAVSKLAGENFVCNILDKYFLIRTSGLYGEGKSREKGYNFVEALVGREMQGEPLRVVCDQTVSPTSASELAEKIGELIQTSHYGLYHLTNEGECSWYEFARTIFSILGKSPRIEAVDSSAYGAKARRPAYSVLENKRAKDIGLSGFSSWKDALEAYLRKRGYLT